MKKISIVAVVLILLVAGWYFVSGSNGPSNGDGAVPTSADNAPVGSIHNLPVPDAVAAVRTKVAQEVGVDEGVVIIMTAYEREWSNACLGLATQDELCAQVITSGFEVTVQVSTTGEQFKYRTNSSGSVLREE